MSQNSSRWLWLPLLLAAVTFALAGVDLLAGVISFVGGDRPKLGLTLPGLMVLLSALTLRLGIPAIRLPGKGPASPKWLCWLALLFSAAIAILSGAEMAYGVAEEGFVVLFDFPIVMAFISGLSCSVLAFSELRRPRSVTHNGT